MEYAAFLSGIGLCVVLQLLFFVPVPWGEVTNNAATHVFGAEFGGNNDTGLNQVIRGSFVSGLPFLLISTCWGYLSLRGMRQWRWRAVLCAIGGWASVITLLLGFWLVNFPVVPLSLSDSALWRDFLLVLHYNFAVTFPSLYPERFAAPLGLIAAGMLLSFRMNRRATQIVA